MREYETGCEMGKVCSFDCLYNMPKAPLFSSFRDSLNLKLVVEYWRENIMVKAEGTNEFLSLKTFFIFFIFYIKLFLLLEKKIS